MQLKTYQTFVTVFTHGDDVQDFDSRWDQALLAASEIP